jgi:tetratricopeptide (TPR) repeat protein
MHQSRIPFWGYPDSQEAVIELTRGDTSYGANAGLFLANLLMLRGHLRESAELLAHTPPGADRGYRAWTGQELALLGGRLPDSHEAWLLHLLDGPFRPDSVPSAAAALGLWTARGDTVHLRRLERVLDSLARNPKAIPDMRRALPMVRAFLTFARGDSGTALRQLMALPDSEYDDGILRLIRANLLAAAGRDSEAAQQLEHSMNVYVPLAPDGLRMLQRGRVAERLGRREDALESYQWVTAIWRNADPELQPLVQEARAGLQRLTAEPKGKASGP